MTRVRGALLLDGELVPGALTLGNGRIVGLERDVALDEREARRVLAPGLVDLHVHGYGGHGPLEDPLGMGRALARAGTTAFQPTLFPAAPGRLGEACERLWSALGRRAAVPAGPLAARVLGLHLEGPFVNPGAAGALPRSELAAPSVAALRAILGPASGDGRGVRTLTVAPELPGAAELVAEALRCGLRVSLGHSLASAPEARAALRAGATGVTHLFNAMCAFHHRAPGLLGVALTDDAVAAEIIGDLVHVGPEAFELALRARGPLGLCLVSDALAGAGTGCERFHAGGREHLARDGAFFHASLEPGGEPTLAGSACSQLEMVRRLVGRGVVSLVDALTMAGAAPARALGLERELGVLAVGAHADLVALERGTLELEQVWVAGEPVLA